jgi:hypothetical protein
MTDLIQLLHLDDADTMAGKGDIHECSWTLQWDEISDEYRPAIDYMRRKNNADDF